ncbi:hypothetical protein GGI35DRAFT_414810 [Trichoderma velutinum]
MPSIIVDASDSQRGQQHIDLSKTGVFGVSYQSAPRPASFTHTFNMTQKLSRACAVSSNFDREYMRTTGGHEESAYHYSSGATERCIKGKITIKNAWIQSCLLRTIISMDNLFPASQDPESMGRFSPPLVGERPQQTI